MQVHAFLQLGKNAGKDSICVAVDVATELMQKKGITPKFTSDELRDMISQTKCHHKGAKPHLLQAGPSFAVEWGNHINQSARDTLTGVSGESPTHSG